MKWLIGSIGSLLAIVLLGSLLAFKTVQDGNETYGESRFIEQMMLESMSVEPFPFGWIAALQDKIYSHIYDEKAIIGISDSGHSHGKYQTIVFYKDKNGKKKFAQSDSPAIAQVAGEIKNAWGQGLDPKAYEITMITDVAGSKLQTLGFVTAKPKPKPKPKKE